MKRVFNFYYIVCIALLFAGATSAQAGNNPVAGSAPAAVSVPAAPGFHFEVVASTNTLSKGVQSMAAGHATGHWLFVGGRTNGFHLTFSSTKTFPTKYSNEDFVVYNPATGKTTTLAIPSKYQVRLRATNMEYAQDGDILYCVGGYGSNCPEDNNNCYITMPYITAINVPKAVAAVNAGDATALAAAIISLEDERMAVTGGVMRKLGEYFYLVFGQDYVGKYKSGLNGTYTQQVARFKLAYSATELSLEGYQAFKDPATPPKNEYSQYRRRDLNVTEEIFGNGTLGLSVWGGVFTINDGGWPNPIFIMPDGDSDPSIEVQTDFEQKCNYYESANLGLYDPAKKVMYRTLFGGISNYYYSGGKLVPGEGANALPWVNIVTTMAISADGTAEYVQPESQSMPELIGANAEFFPADDLQTYGDAHEIYDLSQINGDRVLVGHIAAGIRSTAAQTNGINPTFANEKIYEVYLVRD